MTVSDLFTPEEFAAELRIMAAEGPSQQCIPELQPYASAMDTDMSMDEFMNVMGTLTVVQRILLKKGQRKCDEKS